MRAPTPVERQFAWHAHVMSDRDAPIEITEVPECGYYKTRLVPKGPWVPVKITLRQIFVFGTRDELEQPEEFVALVNEREADAWRIWPTCAGEPISQAEYDYMVDRKRYAEEHASHEPAANPRRAVNWLDVPTPRF